MSPTLNHNYPILDAPLQLCAGVDAESKVCEPVGLLTSGMVYGQYGCDRRPGILDMYAGQDERKTGMTSLRFGRAEQWLGYVRLEPTVVEDKIVPRPCSVYVLRESIILARMG